LINNVDFFPGGLKRLKFFQPVDQHPVFLNGEQDANLESLFVDQVFLIDRQVIHDVAFCIDGWADNCGTV
jgi:hypothetical protein